MSVYTSREKRNHPRFDEATLARGESAVHGPDGGTWTHADWTARLRPTTSDAITAYPMRDIWLIEVAAPFTDVAQEVDYAVGQALAECPRGVVLEFTVPPTPITPDQLDLLAATGRHPWAWPATPVALFSSDTDLRIRLQHHPYGRHLTQCSSMLQGWAEIMNTDPAPTAHLRLVPSARASRVARQFVARICLDWHLARRRDAAVVIASELTNSAVQHAATALDVLLALSGERLRIAVRDRNPSSPGGQSLTLHNPRGHGPRVVDTLADLTGTLPTKGGGRMAWAILGPR